MSKTKLKKLHIEQFRALNGVDIEFGDHITVVCGKNGTSKSSILGIAAQIFSFDKDYVKDEELSFKQISGQDFKSRYSEHFRISKTFDVPGSMKVNIELYDGYTRTDATAKLELMKRGKFPRPVVRNNSTAPTTGNTSRNFTHPVIFLSLKRLYPIADRKYKEKSFPYLDAHQSDFIGLTNELLNRSSSRATGTAGTISSAVSHGDYYDQESVSAGEDNAGQIIMALMSFRKLKEDYPDYKGGLLLIDEADAGLFPTAQVNLFNILARECKNLSLQVIMTSHSPKLIEYAHEQSNKHGWGHRTVYLSNTFGSVEVKQDWSWPRISADINTETVAVAESTALPKINVYFEDKEAYDLFAALLKGQTIKKFLRPLADVSLGCNEYLRLIRARVRDFSENGVVCLDADAARLLNAIHPKTVVLLPGHLPPDQLIFEHLFNLPPSHSFWTNQLLFTRDVFTNTAANVIMQLGITGDMVNVTERVGAYPENKKPRPRDIFKDFYNSEQFQRVLGAGTKGGDPWKHWIMNNTAEVNAFLDRFNNALHVVMKQGWDVDNAKLSALTVRHK
jgi:predicted ATPase